MIKALSLKKRKGLTLYSFNHKTQFLAEHKGILPEYDENCYYFQALNMDNAERKVKNYYNSKIPEK